MIDENVSPHLEKGVKGDIFNVFKRNPYLVAYHWKALLKKKNNDA